MNVYTRYFRVTSGPIMDRAIELEAANAEARKVLAAFCKEIGAEDLLSYSDGRRAGFRIRSMPDPAVWRWINSLGAYWPRKNTAAGRDMLARIEALPTIVHIKNAIEAVGLHAGLPVLISNRCGHSATLTGIPRLGVLFLGVPWRDIDPAKLAEYKRNRAAGTEFSTAMDHLCWEPSAELQEVKRWEVEKEIEELNARLRAEQEGGAA